MRQCCEPVVVSLIDLLSRSNQCLRCGHGSIARRKQIQRLVIDGAAPFRQSDYPNRTGSFLAALTDELRALGESRDGRAGVSRTVASSRRCFVIGKDGGWKPPLLRLGKPNRF